MATQSRPAMRLLSHRLLHLQRPATIPRACTSQIRHISSRYSNPGKRSYTAAPTQPSYFVNPAGEKPDFEHFDHDAPPRNPLDARAVQLAAQEKRAYHMRRMRFAAIGMMLSVVGLALTLYNLDLDEMQASEKKRKASHQLDASSEGAAQFQGKEVHVIGAGEGKRIVAQGDGGDIELVETGTSSVPHFPRTIYLPTNESSDAATGVPGVVVTAAPNSSRNPGNSANEEQYTLLGLGIRTVSFLSIQVYVVGMYVRTQDITGLQEKLIHKVNPTASTLIPSEKADLTNLLLGPESSQAIWSELLEVPGMKTAWRVAPTRNTDFLHLRDGWITGINKRTAEAKKLTGTAPSEYDAEDFGQSVRGFMNVFGGGKAPKGSVMILSRDTNGALDVWFQAKPDQVGKEKEMQRLGTVADERIGRLIWLNYLGGDKVSSEAARKGVVDGCVAFASRPVGSVETMVT